MGWVCERPNYPGVMAGRRVVQPTVISARQPGKQPALAGGYGGQDLLELFRRPVVGQLAGGIRAQFYRGRLHYQLCHVVYRGLPRCAHIDAQTPPEAPRMADFGAKSAIVIISRSAVP